MFKDTKVLGVIAFVLVGLFIGIAQPLTGLAPLGHYILATVIVGLGFWIFKPGNMPFTVGVVIIIAGALIFGLGFNVATAGFTSSAVWVLIPALYFGFILQKTGLGKRVAYLLNFRTIKTGSSPY